MHNVCVLGMSGAAVALGLSFTACREQPVRPETARPASQATPVSATSSRRPAAQLPEDPSAGTRAKERWREHLRYEERERRMRFDRRQLGEHRALTRKLQESRRAYDAAASTAKLARATDAFRASLPQLVQAKQAIDPWGNSSNLLAEYGSLIELLTDRYPKARAAALTGDSTSFKAVELELEGHFRKIDSWLEEVTESEDE